MSVVNLESLFNPKSVAVIGASNTPNNIGHIMMKNIMSDGFLGPVMPVSSEADAIAGVLTYPTVHELPKTPDLAIICRPIQEAPEIIEALHKRGTKAVMLLGSDFERLEEKERDEMKANILAAAHYPDMRVLGPKCLGFIAPHLNLNASLAHTSSEPGRLAFITQSDSLFTTVLDWAKGQNIGFSHLVALGSRIDVTIADVLNYLSSDPYTRAILLYLETVCNARDFMSAVRAASRNKPVLVIRPGQAIESVLRGESQDIDFEGRKLLDEIYDIAFKRAGMLRVNTIDELFDGARTLADIKPVRGDRLAIVSNGDSVGIVAADSLLTGGGRLATFSEETKTELNRITDASWTLSNPVSIPFNSTGEHYAKAVKVLLKDKGVDAVLVMHVPFAGVDAAEAAQGLADSLKRVRRMVLTSWLGTGAARQAREIFHEAGVPTYDTPDKAIRTYLFMVEYQRNQEMLIETPASLPSDFFPDTTTARNVITDALKEERDILTEPEAKDVLASYGIPVVETRITVSARDAVIAADELGYPVALKLRSPQISQPLDVGGVILDLETAEQVWDASANVLARVSRERPDAYIEGFTVQKMGRRPGAHELFISAKVDPVFGPVIHFGHGGMSRDMVRDRAVALPPLSMSLARELVSRTRISKLLPGTPAMAKADLDDICLTVIQVSQLLIDLPQIISIDINPLYADDLGVLALGAMIEVAPFEGDGPDRLAIRPYPRELEECTILKDGSKITIRPIRPEDEPAHRVFINNLSDEDLRLRFFGSVRRDFDQKDMAAFTQIDYDREMAFIAQSMDEKGNPKTIGVSRTITRPDNAEAEFAIVISSELKGQGLGSLLFKKSIDYTRDRGTTVLSGQTMFENKGMQGLAKKFGFSIKPDPLDDDLVVMELDFSKGKD